MARFKQGQSGNPAGRPKGAKNAVTRELREKLKNLIDSELEALPDLLSKLEPQARLEMIIKLMPFALPKVASIDSSAHEPFEMAGVDFPL